LHQQTTQSRSGAHGHQKVWLKESSKKGNLRFAMDNIGAKYALSQNIL
jgi:hypothetical protein